MTVEVVFLWDLFGAISLFSAIGMLIAHRSIRKRFDPVYKDTPKFLPYADEMWWRSLAYYGSVVSGVARGTWFDGKPVHKEVPPFLRVLAQASFYGVFLAFAIGGLALWLDRG